MPPRTQMDTGLGNEIEWGRGDEHRVREFRHIRRCVTDRLLIWLTSLGRSLDVARSVKLAACLLYYSLTAGCHIGAPTVSKRAPN